jgi:hypothetical protein
MREPQITINGVTLNNTQAMTIRSAITHFLMEMSTAGALGEDETGEGIRKGYQARSAEIVQLMISPLPPQPREGGSHG